MIGPTQKNTKQDRYMGKKKQTTKQQKNIDRKNRRTGLKRTKISVQSQRHCCTSKTKTKQDFNVINAKTVLYNKVTVHALIELAQKLNSKQRMTMNCHTCYSGVFFKLN